MTPGEVHCNMLVCGWYLEVHSTKPCRVAFKSQKCWSIQTDASRRTAEVNTISHFCNTGHHTSAVMQDSTAQPVTAQGSTDSTSALDFSNSAGGSPFMPALLQLESNVQVQVLQNSVGRWHFATEPALSGPFQIILTLDVQISLKQVVHHNKPHLHQQSSMFSVCPQLGCG